jgi:hypothetical protein
MRLDSKNYILILTPRMKGTVISMHVRSILNFRAMIDIFICTNIHYMGQGCMQSLHNSMHL